MSETLSNVSTFVKNATDRSMSETVMPTVSTEPAIGSDAARGPEAGTYQATNATRTSSVRMSVHPLQQVVTNAQRIGHDRQRRVHGPARGEKAAVHDVEVVHVVRSAHRVE